MNKQEFKHIQVRIRFLKYACNGNAVHPFDIDDLWQMRESLAQTTFTEFGREGFDLAQIQLAIHELDKLLDAQEIC